MITCYHKWSKFSIEYDSKCRIQFNLFNIISPEELQSDPAKQSFDDHS